MVGVDGMTQGGGYGDGLAHKVAGEGTPGGRLQNILGRERRAEGLFGLPSPARDAVEARRTGDAESVEGDVPDEFAPTGLQQIGADFARNTGRFQHGRQGAGALGGKAEVFAQQDGAEVDMANSARGRAIEAH